MTSCATKKTFTIKILETSGKGNNLRGSTKSLSDGSKIISLNPEVQFQTINPVWWLFTEASAYLLNKLSPQNRKKILDAYFGDAGAKYSLTRTHIGSCDFSLKNYTYATIPNDKELSHFSIEEDMDDIVPMIKGCITLSAEGFKIIASPWICPTVDERQ